MRVKINETLESVDIATTMQNKCINATCANACTGKGGETSRTFYPRRRGTHAYSQDIVTIIRKPPRKLASPVMPFDAAHSYPPLPIEYIGMIFWRWR